jgi:hypothetical protein
MRVLTDFHHSSLLRATNMLFGDRLGMEVFRPIGMEWFDEGFWAINDQRDTAEQFLQMDSWPADGTTPLNGAIDAQGVGWHTIADPGEKTHHKACTLEFFKRKQFDYVIASIPQHIKPMQKLINLYSPGAKLIIQVGNGWDLAQFRGHNVLASVAPRPTMTNALFYHQEFDLDIFHPTKNESTLLVSSFINILQRTPAWDDFEQLEALTAQHGFKWRSYGGQCRDGNMNGPEELARAMRESMLIFHVKPGGDGFGHIIHNAYAVGRPIITRSSHYKDTLAEELLEPGTFIDLDKHSIPEAKNIISRLAYMPEQVEEMGIAAAKRFRSVVDYEQEAKEVSKWLETLK